MGGGMGAAQVPGVGKISGVVLDSLTNQALTYANVVLREALEDIEKDGQLTDDDGKFKFKELKNMKYELVISYLGYQTKIIGPYKINKDITVHDLGKIYLSPLAKSLNEVTVTGTKDIVENKIDRIVYNAEKDVTTKGGDASEVLRRTPMLAVDPQGNVSLRGSTNVQILINGKPSSIMSTNVGDALKMIPADVIEKVEVITQPGAKYDAEGTAGIVNIITKTKKMRGLSGSINASLGTRSNFIGTNLSSRQGKIGFNANIGGHFWRGNSEFNTFRQNYLVPVNPILKQSGTATNNGGGLFLQLGSDYDINDKNSLTFSLRTPVHQFANNNNSTTYLGNTINSIAEAFSREGSIVNRNLGADVNLDYKKTFSKESDREFSISSQYSYSNRSSNYETNQFDSSSVLNYVEHSPNAGYNKELTFAMDYLHPIKKNYNLELGAKTILRTVFSDIYYDTLNFTSMNYLRDKSRDNVFDYNQNVLAAYSQFTFPLSKKLTARAGLRFESTAIEGKTQNESTFSNGYGSWIPSGLLSYNLKNGSIKGSYSRRIQRPSMFYLNPYINFNDPNNISYGNPALAPELTESFELAHSYSKNFINFNSSVYYKTTTDLIDNYRFIDSLGRVNSTYNNLATSLSSGMSITAGVVRLNKIILNSTANVFYQKIKSQQFAGVRNDGVNFNLNAFAMVYLNPNWSVTFFGFYNSPKLTTQGQQATWFVYSLGLRKEMWKKKGGISIGVDNPFHPKMNINSYFESKQFVYDQKSKFAGWGVRASIDYRFGKMEFGQQPKKSKKGAINDDLKQGEGDGQGSGMGGGR